MRGLFRSPKRRFFTPLTVWLISGLLITIWLEHEAVASGSWAYGRPTPAIGGVGLVTLLQWAFVPRVWLWIVRWRSERAGSPAKVPGPR